MQAAPGIGFIELVLILIMSGGGGAPVGIPPEAEDPLMAKIAPADGVYYLSWAASGTPNASGLNSTEKFFADPQIKSFITSSGSQLEEILRTAGANSGDAKANELIGDVSRLINIARRRAASIFIDEISLPNPAGGSEAFKLKGGIVVNMADDSLAVKATIDRLISQHPNVKKTTKEIGKVSFQVIELPPNAPFQTISVGTRGKYLIVAVGEGEAEAIVARAAGNAPAWLTVAKNRLKVPRPSMVSLANVGKVVGAIKKMDPKADQAVTALGLGNVVAFTSVTGLDESGCVSRSLLQVNGAPSGLLGWIDAKPLTLENLKGISSTAPLVAAFKLDPAALVEAWLNMVAQIDPQNAHQMRMSLDVMEQQSGIKIRQDVLGGLGDTWVVYADAQAGGLVSGWTIRNGVRDPQKFGSAYQKLMAAASASLAQLQGRPGTPTLKTTTVGKDTIYSLSLPQTPIPVSPSWCLTQKDLIISANLKGVQNALSPPAGSSIADAPAVASSFEGAPPLAIAHADAKQIVRTLIPLVQLAAGTAAQTGAKLPIDFSKIPPVDVLEKHLIPTVVTMKRVPDGLELMSHETVPGANPAAALPAAVAVLLPAVGAARGAAQRTSGANNLKQIGLAMHNFHDTFRTFPALHNVDASGKKLLSWRVHILPFVEQAQLYQQFHLDEPWDSEHNKKLIDQIPPIYRAPGIATAPGTTVYLSNSSKDGVFQPSPNKDPKSTGSVGIRNITDGTSNTIAVFEAGPQSAVIWTKPDDWENPDDIMKTLVGGRPNGFQVLFCDGSVRFIAQAIDVNVLKALITKSGGEVVPNF